MSYQAKTILAGAVIGILLGLLAVVFEPAHGAVRQTLVEKHLAWIDKRTQYTIPVDRPPIVFSDGGKMTVKTCRTEHCTTLGMYDGGAVYLWDKMDPDTNVCAESVLLHELIHFVQEANGAFANLPPALRHNEQEAQAYSLQSAWLAEQGLRIPDPRTVLLTAYFSNPMCWENIR